MKSHKYKPGRRLNIYTTIFSTAIFCIWLISGNDYENTYVAEKSVYLVPVIVKPEPTIEDKIMHYFPRNGKTMIAVAHAESGMNMNAIGYNCIYNGVSKACKVEDRHRAWSRDCGILQLNTTAKSCPNETVDEHLKRAADLSRIQGLEAWVAYNNNLHLKYLAQNEKN